MLFFYLSTKVIKTKLQAVIHHSRCQCEDTHNFHCFFNTGNESYYGQDLGYCFLAYYSHGLKYTIWLY